MRELLFRCLKNDFISFSLVLANADPVTALKTNLFVAFASLSNISFPTILPVGEKLTISVQGEFRYSYSEYENNDVFNSYSGHTNEYFIGVRPGITYFLNKKNLTQLIDIATKFHLLILNQNS